MKPDLFWIPGPWRGRLAIAARPRGGDWLEDEAIAWQHAGIDTIVSLLEDDEAAQLGLADERRAVESQALSFLSFPIPDRSVPISTEAPIELIGRITAQLKAGKTVGVHCRQGVGRSGLVAAGVLVSAGFDTENAIRTVSCARGISIPETQEQRRWIEQLPPRMPVPAKTGF
jgi:protein-tyrosine phosphatase